jgi:hypothetical protein
MTKLLGRQKFKFFRKHLGMTDNEGSIEKLELDLAGLDLKNFDEESTLKKTEEDHSATE